MLCQNCGKNEVTFRYTQIINGVKKEMALCDKCAKNLGLESLDFNMPINFSNFLGDFFDEVEETGFLPSFTKTGTLKCDNCGTTYDEFIKTGKFGCSNCYDVFSHGLDNVLKNIHSSNTHLGRRSKWTNKLEESRISENNTDTTKSKMKTQSNETQNEVKTKNNKTKDSKQEKLNKLNDELKQAIKEERYEDAAKIRDEIKKMG